MAKKAKTRRHPGVALIPDDPEQRHWWKVRYRHPDTGKMVKRTLDRALRTKAMREDYAVTLSEQLARRRLELESGATRATGTPFSDAIQRYYDAHPRLRPRAVVTYKLATDKLIAFAHKRGIKTVDDLNRAKLMMFREQIVNEPKRYSVPNGKRGAKRTEGERRSAHSINRELRAVSTALRYLVDCDLFSKLSHDDIRRACKPLKAPHERKDYLKPAEIKRLLEAAQRHDREVFKVTRAKGSQPTPRYPAIAPFTMFVLLTGMRFGEAIGLQWKDVDLDALDAGGKKVGEIYISAKSKTSKARTVGLEVSPMLRKLLVAQKLRTGGKGTVWGLTDGAANAAMKRLVAKYGAPKGAGWQKLRITCATFLCNAVGIFGTASPFKESRQLGHSIKVAEDHYVGLIRGIPIEAKDLESAMQIAKPCTAIVEQVQTRRAA